VKAGRQNSVLEKIARQLSKFLNSSRNLFFWKKIIESLVGNNGINTKKKTLALLQLGCQPAAIYFLY